VKSDRSLQLLSALRERLGLHRVELGLRNRAAVEQLLSLVDPATAPPREGVSRT
jgi:hypothetical protein